MILRELDFTRLKEAVSIEQVLAQRGLLDGLRLRGHQLVGACPVHGGDNPRAFVVDRHKGLWRCFTICDGGGDVVELIRRLDHVGYSEVARRLMTYTTLPPVQLPPPRPASSRPFRPFLRKLTLDPHAPLLRQKQILPETARSFEVGAWHGGGMLTNCVAFRLRDPTGRPLGYAGRRTNLEQAHQRSKWVFPPRLPKSQLLYGFIQANLSSAHGLVAVECPWGVLRLAQLSVPAVALLGTSMSAAQMELLLRAPRLVVLMDGDRAGRQASRMIAQRLPNTTVVDMPDHRDPDELSDADLARLVRPHLPS